MQPAGWACGKVMHAEGLLRLCPILDQSALAGRRSAGFAPTECDDNALRKPNGKRGLPTSQKKTNIPKTRHPESMLRYVRLDFHQKIMNFYENGNLYELFPLYHRKKHLLF
jgi:hypothetical protein